MLTLLIAASLAATPELCEGPPPRLPVPDGLFSPPPEPTRLALDAAMQAVHERLCACLPARAALWPTQVRFALEVEPDEGRGDAHPSLPHPLTAAHSELVSCMGTPAFAFEAYRYRSDMIINGEAGPARFSYPLLLTLREAPRPAPSPTAAPAPPDRPRARP